MGRANFPGPLIARLWREGRVADLPDSALIGRFVAEDREAAESAFEAILARHGPMVLAVCRASLRDRGSAEDAFQATFTVLVRRAGALRRPDRLAPWLHGVALRASKEAARRARRGVSSDPMAEFADGSISPADRLACREAVAALHEEIGRLPESYRAPVVFCDLQGLSHQEAASRLGLTAGAVAVRIHRARRMLRDRLSQRGVGSPLGLVGLPPANPLGAAWRGPATARTILARASWPGPVGDSAFQIARGVLATMTLNIAARCALTALLLTASIALVGPGLAARTGAGGAASASPMTPAPAPDQSSKGDPKSSFDQVYRLGPGEVVKLIPPPFPADREARLKAMRLPEGPKCVIFNQLADGAPTRLKWGACLASDASHNQSFPGLLHFLLSVDSSSEVRVHGVPSPTAAGDWIVRQGASRAEVLVGLNAILREQFRPPLRVAVRPSADDRDVIVARGRYARKLLTEGDPKNTAENSRIFLFAAPGTPERFRRVGTFEQFLFDASTFLDIEPRPVILSQAEGVPAGLIGWEAHAAGRTEIDVESVLRHLTEQTGLGFARERRRILVYHLERAEP